MRSGGIASRNASPSPKTRRTYRSCTSCRAAKTKCNGDQPACLRCRARAIPCAYSSSTGPMWTRMLVGPGHDQVQAQTPALHPASHPPRWSPGASSDVAVAATGPPRGGSEPAYLQRADGVDDAMSDAVADPENAHRPDAHRHGRSRTAHAHISHPSPNAHNAHNAHDDAHDAHDAHDVHHPLSWLYTAQLPEAPELLRRVVDAYFGNVHPLRCFAFVHKPTFMRQLAAAGYRADGLAGPDEAALLQIICAHGAKFCALAYSEAEQAQPAKLVQAAGHEWAKAAEVALMTNYGRITVANLMVAVLLYDYRARLGDFAHALVMSGVTTRLAHALQLNMEGGVGEAGEAGEASADEGGEASADEGGEGAEGAEGASAEQNKHGSLSPIERECRRRLMWACYVIDTWTGSGVDQLTLMREADLHIQLPCNEHDFLFQQPGATAMLGDVLGGASESGNDGVGIVASYVHIVSIWKRVSRYVKHLDTAALPWAAGSEFAQLDGMLRAWYDGLAPHLAFTADSVYTRLESAQLGALALLHCTYYNAVLDLYRIAMPELFSLHHAFRFPPEQAPLLHALQARSFRVACDMAAVFSKTIEAAQGSARWLADAMTPMFAYNSSRVMLYYLVRLHDPARPDTKALVDETVRNVRSNNRALQLSSATMPIATPLLVTARGWLDKLQSGLHRQGTAVTPTAADAVGTAVTETPTTSTRAGTADDDAAATPSNNTRSRASPRSHASHHHRRRLHDADQDDPTTDTPDNVLHPLSLFRLARKTLSEKAYLESTSRASYAGGGLPPLRDVPASHGVPSSPAPPTPQPPTPQAQAQAHLPTSQDHDAPAPAPAPVLYSDVLPMAPPPLPPPPPESVSTNWETTFDDLATGLHVLQDYPHWDVYGFDHISSSSMFDGTTLGSASTTTWPEYR